MTRDDIIRMAREAGLIKDWMVLRNEDSNALARFAALVAAAEREACAKVCDAQVRELGRCREALVAGICAAVIRARGQDAHT